MPTIADHLAAAGPAISDAAKGPEQLRDYAEITGDQYLPGQTAKQRARMRRQHRGRGKRYRRDPDDDALESVRVQARAGLRSRVAERHRGSCLRRRRLGLPVSEDFELLSRPPIRSRATGPILVPQPILFSLDHCDFPLAGSKDDPSYIPPTLIKRTVRAIRGRRRLQQPDHPDFQTGGWVVGLNAIEEYPDRGRRWFPEDV